MDRCRISSLIQRLHGHHEHAYVLRFKVNREDLGRIIAAHGLTPWERVQYLHPGFVEYKSSEQTLRDIELYDEAGGLPSWFGLRMDGI